jgi:hypothetical protein
MQAIQRAALMESLDEAGGFLRTSNEERFSACRRALEQVQHQLQRLALVWKVRLYSPLFPLLLADSPSLEQPVVTSTALYATLGGLLNEVLLRVLDEIETMDDISERESVRLNELCTMLHGLESLFEDSEVRSSSSSPPPPSLELTLSLLSFPAAFLLLQTSVGREVPVWFKFVFLSELLEASMVRSCLHLLSLIPSPLAFGLQTLTPPRSDRRTSCSSSKAVTSSISRLKNSSSSFEPCSPTRLCETTTSARSCRATRKFFRRTTRSERRRDEGQEALL